MRIGRGTSTFDGMSIARARGRAHLRPAKGLGCKTLFATHYHELTDLEGILEGVKNYNIAVKKRGEDITFLRRSSAARPMTATASRWQSWPVCPAP